MNDERRVKRKSLKHIYEQAKSALVFLYPYQDIKKSLPKNFPIASYSMIFDEDYHLVLKHKLSLLLEDLREIFSCEGLVTVDTHPILEKDLAYRAGLGWIGKNTLLINPLEGSYVLIGSIILNEKLPFLQKTIIQDFCGSCRKCIDVCPTQAIKENKVLQIDKCIATYTIETFKEEQYPEGFLEGEKIFGCDLCQEVCPWNIKPLKKAIKKEFSSHQYKFLDFFSKNFQDIYSFLENLSKKQFSVFFSKTVFERPGKKGFLKNLRPFLGVFLKNWKPYLENDVQDKEV